MNKPLRRLPKHRISDPRLILPSEEAHTFREIEDNVRSLLREAELMPKGKHRDQIMGAVENVMLSGDIEELYEVTKWRRTPVDLDEFLFGNIYLGLRPSELYPGVLHDLHQLDTGKYVEAVLKGAIGGGKTTEANLGILRQLYFISCLRNPQATFGVQRNSSIVFTIQSVRLSTAKKAVFGEMGAYIGNSPYFNEVYPYDKRIASEMIFREQRVTILPVSSSDTGAISMNVIGGLLDEMNFMEKIKNSKKDNIDAQGEYDQAKTLYLNLSKRRRSRFMTKGNLPGILFLVSSSRYPDDFTEIKAMEAEMMGGNDPSIYVASRSLWEAKGRDKFAKEEFTVLIGNESRRSEILPDGAQVPPGMEVINVPVDLKIEFEKDIDGSIRDLAGRTTLSTKPFIRNRESIHECLRKSDEFGYRNIFELETYDLSIAVPKPVEDYIRTDVNQMRVAHVDLSTTGDAAGLAVGHVAGMRTMQRVNPYTGAILTETLPVIAIDFAMRIIPPQNGEIDFSKIRQILFDLNEQYGLPIKILTADGFNSVDFKQIMGKKGYITDYVSMDRTTEPYVSFKNAMLDNRVLLPRHNMLVQELVGLEITRNKSKEKVDHPPRGSKDVADAVCGVVSTLLTRRSAWTGRPKFMGQGGYIMHGNRTVHANVFLPTSEEVQRFEDMPDRKRITNRKIVERKSSKRS